MPEVSGIMKLEHAEQREEGDDIGIYFMLTINQLGDGHAVQIIT